MKFKRFQTRLIVFFVILLATLQMLIMMFVNEANINNAKNVIKQNLQIGSSVFERLIAQRTNTLFEHARLLSADYAFKPAFYSNDHQTILSAMGNHLDRLEQADIMLLVDLDGNIIANTQQPQQFGNSVSWPDLINKAEKDDYAEATGIELIDHNPYQIIVVPYLSPDVSAWILVGFEIDQKVIDELKKLTTSEISIFVEEDDKWNLNHTTLNNSQKNQLEQQLQSSNLNSLQESTIEIENEQYISQFMAISSSKKIVAIMQRSLDSALVPYMKLNQTLQLLFFVGLILAVIAAIFIARKVTKPVKILSLGASEIEQGNYQQRITIEQQDELGELATSFNKMAKGLEEKERVRDLLGKVVSTEIAEELLSKNIELGGEEKQATILFSDIRDFTTLCEGYEPKQILEMLNVYLTSMSEIIDLNLGVIDKFIGDAVMAMFGAPVCHGNDANNAVSTALAMKHSLLEINHNLGNNAPTIKMGIGLNTGNVVAGNMGSPNRMNYTVIGDGVNLAARLEGLTKHYGLTILVSDSTRLAADKFIYQEIDKVTVKGKKEAVSIYQPVSLKTALNQEMKDILAIHEKMLSCYRGQLWSEALELLNQLDTDNSQVIYQIYRDRIKKYQKFPPADGWDFTFKFTQK